MSKSRAPKRKEQEHMPPDEVEDFRNEILEAGMRLISVSGANFPNAELVSNALGGVLMLSGCTIWKGSGSPPA